MYPSARSGFVHLHLLFISVLIFGVFWILTSTQSRIQSNQDQMKHPASVQKSQVYEDSELKFKFEYPSDFEVLDESEDQYSKRTETDYRKNFKVYVAYEPPKFIKGLLVKPKDLKLSSNQFEEVPMTLWIFENPDKLDGSSWYKRYWYYPFVWGIFDEPRKSNISPIMEATVSGKVAGYNVVSYQPGKPKFILLPASPAQRGEPKDAQMFLFKIMEDGDKMLETFKFI